MKKIFFLFLLLLFPIVVKAYYPSDFADVHGETIWMYWTYFESGTVGVKNQGYSECANQVAFGRYQFHYQYDDLYRFMEKMVEIDAQMYGGFQEFLNASNKTSGRAAYFRKNRTRFISLWKNYAALEDERFYDAQDEIAYDEYYKPTKEKLKQVGIDLETFGPVIRGTVWSVAVRDGTLYLESKNSQTYRALVNTYHEGISDEEYLNAIMSVQATKHVGDGSRWTTGQKNAAISAMGMEDRVDVKNPETSKIGGYLGGGALDDPYPNIFGRVKLSTKEIGCNTLFYDRYGEETEFKKFVNDLFFIIRIITPMIIIILTTIDYMKALTQAKEDDIKKVTKKTMKRVMIGLIIFFLPNLLDLIFELFGLYDISNCGIS